MIGRIYRFHGRGSIRRLYANGNSVRSGLLALRYCQNPKRPTYRLAVVVSRKVSKSAVVRNRIRRRIYERVRILYNNIASYDILITAYDVHIATLPAEQLDAELRTLFKKARLTPVTSVNRGIVEPKE